ncbi:hypothetical protein ILUMI_24751 [Ignelater luminosus]|uniref:Uncharacterized protein n=1 Tax=Ignelater luminosus TaxID=2038154 RepID=A0A8K0G0P4_IGNLU|nr:hypothetical protein ILUMI_24751 [Ignelater luminosus]
MTYETTTNNDEGFTSVSRKKSNKRSTSDSAENTSVEVENRFDALDDEALDEDEMEENPRPDEKEPKINPSPLQQHSEASPRLQNPRPSKAVTTQAAVTSTPLSQGMQSDKPALLFQFLGNAAHSNHPELLKKVLTLALEALSNKDISESSLKEYLNQVDFGIFVYPRIRHERRGVELLENLYLEIESGGYEDIPSNAEYMISNDECSSEAEMLTNTNQKLN